MPIHRRRFELRWLMLIAVLSLAWSCAPVLDGRVISRSKDFIVVVAGPRDSLASLAADFLGSKSKAWVIADFNGIDRVAAGQEVVIPLQPFNRAGIYPNGYRKVPILTYHHFSPPGRNCTQLAVTAESFAEQLAYLRDNGFSVIGFRELAGFLEGRNQIPRRSVILTIDDGYRSTYEVAYPILKKFGYRATLFVYTDFVGAPAGLTWIQMKEMVGSGLIDIQPHSKTHVDLTKRLENETQAAYKKRVTNEISFSTRVIKKHLGVPIHTFSYPYGAENDTVVEAVKAQGFKLGTTVTRGGNPSFAHPFVLRRSQVYCSDSLKVFAKRLDHFEKKSLQ